MEIWNLLDSVAVLDISGYSFIDMLLVRISIFAELVKPQLCPSAANPNPASARMP